MSDAKRDDLSELLQQYRERHESVRRAESDRAAVEEEARRGCAKTLREMVLPTVQRLARQILEEGHDARVEDRLAGPASPSVGLRFAPRSPGGQGAGAAASHLVFTCAEGQPVAAAREIYNARGHVGSVGFASAQRRPTRAEPASRWVEDEVVSFVAEVLSAN